MSYKRSTYEKEKKVYRKKYQKFKQTKDHRYLELTQSRFKKKYPSKQKTNNPAKIDIAAFLLTVRNLLKSNQITKQQLVKLIQTLNIKFVSGYSLPADATKIECRCYWLYLMRNNMLFCDICGNPITTSKGKWKLTYDHRQPKSKGGTTDGKNASPTHSICNNLKTNHTPEEWEIIGPAILAAYNIEINKKHCLYNYQLVNEY